ncbi:uncharacterized protein Z518_00133 [Rhinocladiella mackenziei CBS 650.93]|uniref:Uncharacterized protein n=1 Tax=Rhinocladiella mackenziei CBS 650.93 TaxID=1442369 RepID=A0A0D2JI72_9EURO|nr:uncharacterized protein Z518_00133 [Rhinocladiella mackenziei CBS 650.93]KIX09055.1 hypothetical protein Z518_00133 [Rhinocladiella mackenziei CBS 650.93]
MDEARRKRNKAAAAVQEMLDTLSVGVVLILRNKRTESTVQIDISYPCGCTMNMADNWIENGYDVELMTKLLLLEAGPEGSVRWELTVTDFYANQNGLFSSLPPLCREAVWILDSFRCLGSSF